MRILKALGVCGLAAVCLSQNAWAAGPICKMSFSNLDAVIRFDQRPTAPKDENDDAQSYPFSLSFNTTGLWKNPKDPRSLHVVLWMDMCTTRPDHGSGPVTIQRQAVGKYRVTDVYFSMPGPWQIKVQAGREERICEINVERSR